MKIMFASYKRLEESAIKKSALFVNDVAFGSCNWPTTKERLLLLFSVVGNVDGFFAKYSISFRSRK
jgi:hypothetical protein